MTRKDNPRLPLRYDRSPAEPSDKDLYDPSSPRPSSEISGSTLLPYGFPPPLSTPHSGIKAFKPTPCGLESCNLSGQPVTFDESTPRHEYVERDVPGTRFRQDRYLPPSHRSSSLQSVNESYALFLSTYRSFMDGIKNKHGQRRRPDSKSALDANEVVESAWRVVGSKKALDSGLYPFDREVEQGMYKNGLKEFGTALLTYQCPRKRSRSPERTQQVDPYPYPCRYAFDERSSNPRSRTSVWETFRDKVRDIFTSSSHWPITRDSDPVPISEDHPDPASTRRPTNHEMFLRYTKECTEAWNDYDATKAIIGELTRKRSNGPKRLTSVVETRLGDAERELNMASDKLTALGCWEEISPTAEDDVSWESHSSRHDGTW